MIKRKILSLAEAQKCLAPYYEKIEESVSEGFSDYLKISSCSVERVGYVDYKTRTKANLIHDHIAMRVHSAFSGITEVLVDEWNGVFALKINDDLFIRHHLIHNLPLSVA